MYHFYLQNYDKAIKKFNKSLDLAKRANSKSAPPDLSDLIEESEEHASPIDDYEFENQTYNIYEFQYNISLCYLMMQKYQDAVKLFKILHEMMPDDQNKKALQ